MGSDDRFRRAPPRRLPARGRVPRSGQPSPRNLLGHRPDRQRRPGAAAREWKGPPSIEAAIAEPVPGQDTTLHEPSLIGEGRGPRFDQFKRTAPVRCPKDAPRLPVGRSLPAGVAIVGGCAEYPPSYHLTHHTPALGLPRQPRRRRMGPRRPSRRTPRRRRNTRRSHRPRPAPQWYGHRATGTGPAVGCGCRVATPAAPTPTPCGCPANGGPDTEAGSGSQDIGADRRSAFTDRGGLRCARVHCIDRPGSGMVAG